MRTTPPSLADLRAVVQPDAVVGRRSAEHWAGRLYMRRISLHVTRRLVTTSVSAHQLTATMIVVGLAAAVVLAWPGLVTAVVAVVAIQLYLLLDCVDGEVARWRATTGAAGVYLDRLGHHVVEAALLVGLGVRASGGPSAEPSWWVAIGAVTGLLVVLGKLESDLIVVARAGAGLPSRDEADPSSKVAGVRTLRRLVGVVPVHRVVGAIELTLLLVVAAGVDLVTGDLVGTRGLLVGTLVIATVVAVGHPITILTSDRLR